MYVVLCDNPAPLPIVELCQISGFFFCLRDPSNCSVFKPSFEGEESQESWGGIILDSFLTFDTYIQLATKCGSFSLSHSE